MNQTNQTNSLHWYALRTKSRHEKHVRDCLERKGIESLLPTVKRLSQWKDRKKEVELPLFSCYCFVRFSGFDWHVVRMVKGVIEILGSENQPERIPDAEIGGLKELMTNALQYDAHPYLHEGMRVEVVRGPLQGVRGILVRKEKDYRLVIGIRLIQQAVVVEVDANEIVRL